MKKIKVLLIEDNRLLRDGTESTLNEQPDIFAVSTSNTNQALQAAIKLSPNVVLLDPGLKSRKGQQVLESIKERFPLAEVLVLDLVPLH